MNLLINIFPAAGQTVTFDLLTIIFLIVILINVISGLVKGFIKELISFFGFFIILAVSFLLSKPLGNLFNGWFGGAFSGPIYNSLVGKSAQFAEVMTREAATENLPDMLSAAGIPSFLKFVQEPIIKYVVGCIPETDVELAVGSYVANSVALLACSAIAFVAIAIVMIIIFVIIKKVTKNLNAIPVVGWLNKLLGAILGIAAGIIVVAGLGSIISMLLNVNFINDFIVGTLKVPLGDDTRWSFAKLFIENDFIKMIVGYIFN